MTSKDAQQRAKRRFSKSLVFENTKEVKRVSKKSKEIAENILREIEKENQIIMI